MGQEEIWGYKNLCLFQFHNEVLSRMLGANYIM
jgi:hypothetical protein